MSAVLRVTRCPSLWDWTVFLSLVHSSEILRQCPIFCPLCGTSVGIYPSECEGKAFYYSLSLSNALPNRERYKVPKKKKSQVWQILVKMMKNITNNMKRQYWNPETVSRQYSSWNNSENGNIKRLSHVTTIKKKKTSLFSLIVGRARKVRFKYNISGYLLALCTTFCHKNTVKPNESNQSYLKIIQIFGAWKMSTEWEVCA